MSNAKISPERLHYLLIEVLNKSDMFSLENGSMPFEMTWGNNHF